MQKFCIFRQRLKMLDTETLQILLSANFATIHTTTVWCRRNSTSLACGLKRWMHKLCKSYFALKSLLFIQQLYGQEILQLLQRLIFHVRIINNFYFNNCISMMQKFCRSYFPLNSLFLLQLYDVEILNALQRLENDTWQKHSTSYFNLIHHVTYIKMSSQTVLLRTTLTRTIVLYFIK